MQQESSREICERGRNLSHLSVSAGAGIIQTAHRSIEQPIFAFGLEHVIRVADRGYNVPLGIIDERVRVGDQVAYLWHNDLEFEQGCDFLTTGLRDHDHVLFPATTPRIVASALFSNAAG